MSLKTRFLLLVLGSVLIPNIIIILIVGISFGGIESIRSLHNQIRVYNEIVEMGDNRLGMEEYAKYIGACSDIDYYLYTPSMIYLSSSTGINDLEKALSRGAKFQTSEITFSDGSSALLYIHLPALEHFTMLKKTPLQVIAPLTLLSVLSFFSLVVIRSINISLKRIEEATKRVSDGDYSIELPIRGNDSIASLSRSFNKMVGNVKEEYSRRSRFFMGVSHDLKTPLASISGYADAILEGYAVDNDTLIRYAGIIKSKSGQLLDRLQHLIEFVKLETGDWKNSFEPVFLKRFLFEITDAASIDAQLYHFKFISSMEIDEEIFTLMDGELVRRALDNIIHNAFRYGYENSIITFSVRINGEDIEMSVTNTGEGIKKEDLNYIFEPFYRGASVRNEDGSGLGLANVAAVIKSHGWRISAKSEVGGETVFSIFIPLKNCGTGGGGVPVPQKEKE